MPALSKILVLGGGPDAERDVSLKSSSAIAQALRDSGRYDVQYQVIDRLTPDQLRAMPGDCIFPALHGKWGEGGPLQLILEQDGRPFVGCAFAAARACMDKVLTKTCAARVGLTVAPTMILDPADDLLPLSLPVVVKPIFEGSTIGLYVCRTREDWDRAHAASAASGKPCMVEPFIKGRELTLGLIAQEPRVGGARTRLEPLPFIQITPAEGLYDYEAKYNRNDTKYLVGPPIPTVLRDQLGELTRSLSESIPGPPSKGVAHLCRADFILDDDNRAWFLELNTMPGFTDHSLVPMAARATGLEMPALCSRLVEAAMHDARVVTPQ
ncbi:MAG: hypothetical protein ACKVZJ_07400 [Phycisphaerales bacterium]